MAIFDFSEYQGNIDFSKVKGNADLVILRVQAGSTHPDADYTKYVAGAKANNIPFGTYAYGKFLNVADAQKEASDCYNRMDKATQFVVVDVESVSTTNPSDLVASTQAFIDYLHAKGVKKVGLYSGEYFYTPHGLDKVKADFLWLAVYGVDDGKPHTKPSIPCDLWQYSSKATESGVIGNVDVDMLNGGKPLSYFTGKSVIPTGDGSGILTISTQGAKLYESDDMNSKVIRTMNTGESYKYYSIVNGWYAVGNSWVRGVDVEVNTFVPAPPKPAPAPAPKPVTPAPAPQPAPVQPAPAPVVAPVVQPSANTVVQPSANTSGNPIVHESVAPAIPVTQPVAPPVQAEPVVPPVDAQPVVNALAQQIEDAVLKDPQLQQSIIKKLFAFITSIFK